MAEIQEKSSSGPFDVVSPRSARRFFKFAAILAAFFVLAGATGYYFLIFKQQKQTPKADEIVITDLPTGEKLVENKTQGYSVKVPQKWVAQSGKEGGSITFFTPAKNKCNFSLSKIPDEGYQDLRAWYRNVYGDLVSDADMKNISLHGLEGLDVIIEVPQSSRTVYLHKPNFIYGFSYYPLAPECSDQLDRMINSFEFK